jgi:hypothetical protein
MIARSSFFIGLLFLILIDLSLVGISSWAQGEEFSRYDIAVRLDPETHTLSGTQTIEYLNDTGQPIDAMIFSLEANYGREENPYLHPALQDAVYFKGFDPTWMKILAVTDGDGQALDYRLESAPPLLVTYSLEETVLRVTLPQSLDPGEKFTVRFDFETKFSQALTGDNNVYRGIYTWRFGWNPIALPEESVEAAKFELPAAFYRVELTVPEGYVVAAGADRQERIGRDEEGDTYLLESDVPVRSIPLVIGRELERYRLFWHDVPIDSYYLPGGEAYGRLVAAYAAEALEYYQAHFGPYGYRRLVIVGNPTPGSFGFGADGMIQLGASYQRTKDLFVPGLLDRLMEYVIAHEVAHQWWGIGVGTDFNAANWLSEGFAEYLSYTYFEEKYGGFEPNLFSHLNDGLLEEFVRSQIGYLNLRRDMAELPYLNLLRNRFDEAIVKPMSEVEYYNDLSVRTYNKGYLVARALEGILGKETMHAILREIYTRANHEILAVDEFRQIAEELSGRDLSGFFTSWLYGADTLDIAVVELKVERVAEGYQTTVGLRKEGAAVYPVTIKGITVDGEEMETVWSGNSSEGIVTFTSPSPVKRVHVDPMEMSPDKNRFNNHFPRLLIIKHPFFEEGWKIKQPLDAYLVSLSPTGISGSFRDDHAWGLTFFPSIPTFDETTLEDVEFLWNATAFFSANLDRGLSLDAGFTVTEFDMQAKDGSLDAHVGLSFIRYEHPPIGAAGQFWWPANVFRISIGALGDLHQPTGYLNLDYARLDVLSLLMENTFSLRLGLPGFGQESFGLFTWGGFKRFRLAHLLYVDANLRAGTKLFGTAPESFQFSLDALYAFEEGFPADRGAVGRLTLQLPPLVRDWGYSLLNIVQVDTVQPALFVQGGQTWMSDESFTFDDPKLEVGAEATIGLTLTPLALAVKVGYAHPILGAEAGAQGAFFVDVAASF